MVNRPTAFTVKASQGLQGAEEESCMRIKVPAFVVTVVSFVFATPQVHSDLYLIRPNREILQFNENSGAFVRELSAYTEAFYGLAFGPEGNLYAAGNILGYGTIFKFSPDGRLLSEFAGPRTPGNIAFDAVGRLYVISSTWPESPSQGLVVRYNRNTGALIDTFVTAGSGNAGLLTDLAFGPDGHLYVADYNQGILRYDGSTGAFLGVFAPNGRGGLSAPRALLFGPDRNLYVSSENSNAVLRFNGQTGAFIDNFVPAGSGGLSAPRGLAFGHDGHLYVSSWGSHQVLRFNGTTGAFIDSFVQPPSEFHTPTRLVFSPPRLKVQPGSNGVTLRWPASYRGYTLVSRGSLGSATSWTPVADTPVQVGSEYVVTKTCSGQCSFFRLERR